MNIYREIHIGITAIVTIVAIGLWVYWYFVCTTETCQYSLTEFIMRPVLWSAIPLSIILATLLYFPIHIFKRWLQCVAVWFVPLSIYIILDTNPYSSGVLDFGRGLTAWILGNVLLGITVLFVFGWHLYAWKRKGMNPHEFWKLLIFIIPAIIFKAIWTLF